MIAPRAPSGRSARLGSFLRSAGVGQGLILCTAMGFAGGLDYAVNVVAGRWLDPVQYGIFVSVTAIVQVLVLLAIAIRMVVGFYAAELTARGDAHRVGAFVYGAWRWAWRWGLAATVLMFLLSPALSRLLRLPNSWPFWAASLMVLMLFLRETAYGVLQGIQSFGGLGAVQVIQAVLRIVFAAGLIWLGGRAVGAIFAQPLSCMVGLVLALWWLQPRVRRPSADLVERPVNWNYSAHTLLGLAVFGVMTNLDALFVKHFFSPQVAGDYAPVVTLAKISLFLPWAIGIVLVPKVTQRQAAGQDSRHLALLALGATLAPGLLLTTLYFLFPGTLVTAIFTGAYADPGIVLGLATLASTLYAGSFIWLNYALSIKRPAFVSALGGVLVWQGLGMYLFGRENLVGMTVIMVSAGLLGNLSGFVTTWFTVPAPKAIRTEAVQ